MDFRWNIFMAAGCIQAPKKNRTDDTDCKGKTARIRGNARRMLEGVGGWELVRPAADDEGGVDAAEAERV
jgi:hypothetical protein